MNNDEYDRIDDGGRCKEAFLPGRVQEDSGRGKYPLSEVDKGESGSSQGNEEAYWD